MCAFGSVASYDRVHPVTDVQVDERDAAAGRTRLCRSAILISGFLERALLARLSFADIARDRVRKPSAESVGERGSQLCAVPVR